MKAKSHVIRVLIMGFVVLPAKVLFWLASAYAVILGLNLLFGARPPAPDTREQLAASIGFAILGYSLLMCGAALARNPDDRIPAHRAARLAALDATGEGLVALACILGIGAFLSYGHGDSSSGLRLGLGFIASILGLEMVRRLEKKGSNRGGPPTPEIRQPEE